MQTETVTGDTTEALTPFRVRLSKQDVAAVRQLALKESLSRGAQVGWCDLLRAALRHMAQEQLAIG
jgi:hypothetical protein